MGLSYQGETPNRLNDRKIGLHCIFKREDVGDIGKIMVSHLSDATFTSCHQKDLRSEDMEIDFVSKRVSDHIPLGLGHFLESFKHYDVNDEGYNRESKGLLTLWHDPYPSF